ncbi:hypothetical protein [Chryseobacterium sp. MDT2-18]|uniref:hypothetical protein n=1 Tax=Chryseobacterium sp. MDT2-18 TaxID=1259136 RepID=UPI002788C417|nr:hypothetical protein [Chryseobacterium sp. MDT2-18]MDQ0477486.1 hypothetical protein [Chryseobacterium sp. MDT2-18]
MSWQLSAGGVISRVVKDETDENHVNWKHDTVNETTDLLQIKEAARSGNATDTEYDWFNFSLSNGLSGSFYIDMALNAYVESKDKLKIEITEKDAPPSAFGKLLEFKITDKYGNQYYFGGSEVNTEKTLYNQKGTDKRAVTGWYLYKFVTPQNKQIIFTYSTEIISYYTSLNAGFSFQQNCLDPSSSLGSYTYSDVLKSKSTILSEKPKLISIAEEGTEISFVYGKERRDVFNNSSGNNLLTSIAIKNNNRLIESYYFEYFGVLKTPAATYYGIPYDERTTTNRHFLKSISKLNQNTKTEFEYYDLDKLPARFSLSSDYYGFPNGKGNFSPFPAVANDNNFGIFDRFHPSTLVLSADRKVNPLLASAGNLKKITHATKGFSEMFYEPNSSMEWVDNEVCVSKYLSSANNKCNPAVDNPVNNVTFISPGGAIKFNGEAYTDDVDVCNNADPIHDTHKLVITDLSLTPVKIVYSRSRPIAEAFDSNYESPVNTVKDHEYKVEYSVSTRFGGVTGWVSFCLKQKTPTKQFVYFGGNRVSSIKESDGEGDSYTKNYYYSPLSDISSGKTSVAESNTASIMAEIRETSKSCSTGNTFPEIQILNVYSAYQNSIFPLFNYRSNNILYWYVTEIIENKSAVEKKFSYEPNQDSYIGHLPMIYDIPDTNSGELKSNLLLEENIYKFENGTYNKSINTIYNYDFNKIKSLKSYVFRENFTYYPQPGEDPLRNISYGYYENQYGFYNPTSIVTKEKISNQILEMTINNQYSNLNYQITSQKTTFPDLSIHETSYQYAHEKGKTDMIESNMVGIPLETTVLKNGKTISKTGINYQKKTIVGKEHILPDLTVSYDLQNPSTPTTEVKYTKYDNSGNLLEYVLKPDVNGIGTSAAIIWGYNDTQPVAKIEGATYAQVSGFITDIVNYSNTDASVGSDISEQDLIDKLDAFRKRTELANFQITTYTYDPLIGVKSITPPNGIREVYIYDTANRLKEVKDISGNILKQFEYNYKH